MAVKTAIKAGYRMIDCANDYGNEHVIGEALQELFADEIVKRYNYKNFCYVTNMSKKINHNSHSIGL